jgi:hypothetical protein
VTLFDRLSTTLYGRRSVVGKTGPRVSRRA